jgi:PAS domain S-box-containing protein
LDDILPAAGQAQQTIDEAQAELHRLNASLAASERALRERETELARVQQIAQVGGVVVDIGEGFHNHRSPEYLAIHGLPPGAANETHEDWVQRIHPEDRARAERQFLDTLAGSDTRYSSEYRIIRPDNGEIRWIAAEARIERSPDGRALRLVGAHIDITERALAQQLLRESEQRFRLIADSAPVPMWVTRLDRKRAFVNRAYVAFLGVGYEEALAFDWRKIIHRDDVERIVAESIAGEASLKLFALEGRYRRADGQWRWIRSESQPRWGATGELDGFIGIAHDITAAKEAEIGLRNLNETLERRIAERTSQLQSILETTNQYQILLDAHGNVVYANATALLGIGSTTDDVLGHPFWDSRWFSGTEGARELALSGYAAAGRGDSTRTEIRLQLPAGERYFDFAMRPVLDREGVTGSVLVEAVDITERRRNEEVLRHAQKMEAVGQLTGGVAHDFNNLLTIIRSATDFLRRRELPEERRRRYIDAISDTADRASKLTGQLLAFARRQPLVPEVFDVAAKVESVAQLIRPLVGSRIRIDLEVSRSECFAHADVAQFETTLVNLAVNGRDAMDGEGTLAISVATVDAIPAVRGGIGRRGDFIAVSVTDTGSGIAAEHLHSIFEPFFTTKEVGKGTGLGLSQAFGFAQQSGGEIAVHSAPGKGTTFTLYLPQAQAPQCAGSEAAARTEPGAMGRGHSILVVEDNEEVGKFSTELLADLGYVVRRVTNAKDALDALAENDLAFDLVFSDVIMPGMNGVELASIIRERFPGLPVVLTSGYSSALAENADHGFDLIQKPYSVETLSRALRKAILDVKRISRPQL